jgi:8-oxo-dGTP pyrophosphatase MutT (NUDIX family)
MNLPSPLIPSATTVLLSPGEDSFEVLLLQRNNKIKTHGGSWVFPGGKCDVEDCDAPDELERFSRLSMERQLEIAKISARREATEEASVTPDLDSLKLCSNWITPSNLAKRFNTFFFIGEHHSKDVRVDQGEICDYCWLTPQEALIKQTNGEMVLPPPTFVLLTQLAEYCDASSAIRSLSENPITYRPKLTMTQTGFHSIYEDDFGYETGSLELAPPIHRLIVDNGRFEYLRDGL